MSGGARRRPGTAGGIAFARFESPMSPKRRAKVHRPRAPGGRSGGRGAGAAARPSALRRFLRVLGPGLVTGASDDDPSGIGTYAAAGASFGYATLWTALVTFPMMAAVQYICAKVGMVSGMGLAGVIRRHYSPWVLYPAVLGLVLANAINVGADIG